MKARLSILIVTLLLILPSRVSGIGPDTIFSDLQKIMERVADWQINNFTYQKTGNLHDYGIDAWTNAVLLCRYVEVGSNNRSTFYLS